MGKKIRRSSDQHTAKNKKKQIKINDLRSLEKIQVNVAGIDVGAEFHYVAAPDPAQGGKVVVNRFGSFTPNLIECVEWLKECNITSVAMEATGVYWMILFNMLEAAGIKVILVNPANFKKMKDAKTDVCDAEYLQLYHSYGLLEGAVIHEQKINELKTLTRLRAQFVEEAASSIQRIQKALITMNLRLDNVLNDISGLTGMKIIHDILDGERDPKKLAQYRDRRCKKSLAEFEDSLHGFYRDDYLFALERAVKQYEFHVLEIEKCDEMIQKKLNQFSSHQNHIDAQKEAEKTSSESPKEASPKKNSTRKYPKRCHEFSFNLKDELIRIAGVDITLLPGIGVSNALTLISETGLDMKKWKGPKQFVSHCGLSPNNKISGGRILKSKAKKKNKAGLIFKNSIAGLYNESNDTSIGAYYRIKRGQKGPMKAMVAAANKLATMYYMTLLTGKPFMEHGAKAYYDAQQKKYLKRIRKRVAQWGYELTEVQHAA